MRLPDSWSHLRDRARRDLEELSRTSDGLDEPVDDWDEILDRAWLEGARRFDTSAQTQPRLDVRVKGEAVGHGTLSMDLADDLFGPLQDEIEAALTGGSPEHARLELAGISQGSAILHLKPTVAMEANNDQLPFAISRIDSAIRQVFDFHDAMEQREPVESFQVRNDLRNAFHKLTKVLQKNELSVEMIWRSLGAQHRRSNLGTRGLEYALSLFELSSHAEQRVVSGYLFEQSLNGSFKLKSNTSKRTSPTYVVHIDANSLSSANLKLNQYLRVQVVHHYQMDKFENRANESYEFVRFLSDDEVAP